MIRARVMNGMGAAVYHRADCKRDGLYPDSGKNVEEQAIGQGI